MARFPGDLTDYKLEVPGQYGTSKRKPLPEYHVNVAGFDEKVCCRFIKCCFCDFINLGLLRAIYECIVSGIWIFGNMLNGVIIC